MNIYDLYEKLSCLSYKEVQELQQNDEFPCWGNPPNMEGSDWDLLSWDEENKTILYYNVKKTLILDEIEDWYYLSSDSVPWYSTYHEHSVT